MNTEKIYEKVKMKIAISNEKEEDIVMNKRKISIGKSIGIAACIALSTTGVVFATNMIINKFGANISDGIATAIQYEYYEDVKFSEDETLVLLTFDNIEDANHAKENLMNHFSIKNEKRYITKGNKVLIYWSGNYIKEIKFEN